MTARQVFEYVLVELNKSEAPSLLLEDFNYFFNKGIYQFINKVYNIYDTSQLTSDELRVLKSTAVLKPTKRTDSTSKLYGSFYEDVLPSDYYHLLNCVCEFISSETVTNCNSANVPRYYAARRLTSDMWPQLLNNFYTKPSYKRPYYFIHNNNLLELSTGNLAYQTSKKDVPTNPYVSNLNGTGLGNGTDQNGKYEVPSYTQNGNLITPTNNLNSNLSRNINHNGILESIVDRQIGVRYGNPSDVRIEIRCGSDSLYSLGEVHVDYLKVPQNIKLTQDQIDLIEDTSLIIEFPDYVCYEIINELVKLVLENSSNPRLQSNIPVNQSIAQPTQTMQ